MIKDAVLDMTLENLEKETHLLMGETVESEDVTQAAARVARVMEQLFAFHVGLIQQLKQDARG